MSKFRVLFQDQDFRLESEGEIYALTVGWYLAAGYSLEFAQGAGMAAIRELPRFGAAFYALPDELFIDEEV
ncbi:hypothetical protein ACWD4V_16125 [Streptomyces tsukubensis]|uniref:hypothetical protein n=1 Tax=Streptomyces tsukubensis TaxID=83656 RepID=UPI0036B53A19